MSHSSMLHGMLGVTGSAVLSQYALQLAGNHCVAQSACRTVSMSHSQYVAQSVCCTVSMSHSQYVAQYVTGDRFRSPLTVCFTVCRHSLCRTVSMSHNSMLQVTGYAVLSQYVLQVTGITSQGLGTKFSKPRTSGLGLARG